MFLLKRKAIFFVHLNMTMKYWTDFIRTFYSPFNREFYFTPFSMFNINILRWLSITLLVPNILIKIFFIFLRICRFFQKQMNGFEHEFKNANVSAQL